MSDPNYAERMPGDVATDLAEFEIIDVRNAFELDGPLGHIRGSRRVEPGDWEALAGSLGNSSVLVVCRSGRRSGGACEALQAAGLADVTNLGGGMIAWNEAGLPIDRTPVADVAAFIESLSLWYAMLSMTAPTEVTQMLQIKLGIDGSTASHEQATAALDYFVARLRSQSAPPDLDLSLKAFTEDLARLATNGN